MLLHSVRNSTQRTLKHYQAIVFDLFSTVALWRPDRMPLFEWRGKTSHSTLGALKDTIEARITEAPFSAFVDGLAAANDALAARRDRELKEFSSLERFELALTNIGYRLDDTTRELAAFLSHQHMTLLAAAVDIPASHVTLLKRICADFPLALVSNFDHGPTARAILERDGAAVYFDPIVISAEHGRRKPHRAIFLDTLDQLGVAPARALYVGDSPADDIIGAKGAGMDVAWVNPRALPLPDDCPTPDFVVGAIPELEPLLLG